MPVFCVSVVLLPLSPYKCGPSTLNSLFPVAYNPHITAAYYDPHHQILVRITKPSTPMPPNRRHRPSLPTSPGADDISGLSLSECRDRLARNERVLNSSLFSSVSPPPSLSTSPTSPFLGDQSTFHAFGSAASASASAGPSRPPAPPVDPVKEKLLLTRQALLQREQELMMAQSTDQVAKLEVGSPESPRFMDTMSAGRRVSGSGGGGSAAGASRSGKARAMEIIRQGEANRSPNAIIL